MTSKHVSRRQFLSSSSRTIFRNVIDYSDGIDGTQQSPRGGDWSNQSEREALTPQEIRDIKEQEARERAYEQRRQYLQRLEDLGVGRSGGGGSGSGGGSSSDSGSSSSSSSSSSTADANIGDPVKGSGEEVKAGTGGPGPLGEITKVPENTGVGAPNKVAWLAVQKGVDILLSGKTMPYAGVRPQTDPIANPGNGIDCSGLILWAYGNNGIAVGGVASGQKYAGNPVTPTSPGAPSNPDTSKQFKKIEKEKDALPGDIYIWGDGAGAGSHVSMVIAKDGDTVITQDYGGGALMQKPGDGSSDGRYFAGIFRPTVLQDGSPTIPEAAADSSDSSDDDEKKDDDKSNEDKDDDDKTRKEDE